MYDYQLVKIHMGLLQSDGILSTLREVLLNQGVLL